jgi:hypothetical protein
MNMDTFINEIQRQKGLIVAVIALGLIFGFLVGRIFKGKEAGEIIALDEQKSAATEKVLSKTEINASTVFLAGNKAAGKVVFVDSVVLTENAWVVVREDIGGEMGNILGAQWLPTGTKSETSVELLRGTEAGKKYYVVLYNDNGDRIFGTTSDFPMKNGDKTISVMFTAQ